MKTKLTAMLAVDLPLFAFSHCRDVVVEASRAGAVGVLGTAWMSPDELEHELRWIDAHIDGRPYGVNVVMPGKYDESASRAFDVERDLPREPRAFINDLLDAAGIAPLPAAEAPRILRDHVARMSMTPAAARELLEVAYRHPIRLVVNALGAPPRDVVDRCHQQGLVVGALVGSLEHGARQRDAGVDFLVAQGAEAGGHVGTISSMVLWPQLVDAMAPMPVLAAGGIGRGRQMAAALALGADGVWCGSIWLGTRESELSPEMKERLFAANSEDAIVTRALTGKPCRALRSRYTDAWEQPGAPAPLPLPLQSFLYGEPSARIARAHASDFMTYAVGQIVGDMAEETSVRRVIQGMLEEFADAIERLNRLADMD